MPEYNLGKVVGTDGKGIDNIAKTSTSDNVDTYTITYTNGDESTFTVTNAPLTNQVSNSDTAHAITPKGVYDYVTSQIGSIREYVNR